MKSNLRFPILIVLVAFATLSLVAQTSDCKFGVITQKEVDMSSCSVDPDAEAVVLFDIGKAWFMEDEGSFKLVYERTTRIKILKESGISRANIEIPYYMHGDISENITKLKGSSWNMKDGKLVSSDLQKSNIFDERQNQYWMNRKVAMPDVAVGTIIEYHYLLTSNYLANFKDWEFQTDIPTMYSNFEVKVIPFYEYIFLLQGIQEKFTKNEFISPGLDQHIWNTTYKEKVYQFSMSDVPAFRDADFMASSEDFISKINFQLCKITRLDGVTIDILTTWPNLIKDFLQEETFGKYIKKAKSQAKNIINLDSLATMDDIGKLNAVIETVKNRYQWNGILSRSASETLSQFLKKKSGTTGQLNLLCVGLLQAAGIDAFPVILSTRENGKIRYDYPFSHFFDCVVIGVKINGQIYLADGTDPLLTSFKLPVRCLNDRGLIIKEGEVTWLDLEQNNPSDIQTKITSVISEDGLLSSAGVVIGSKDYEAYYLKNQFGDNTKLFLADLRSKEYEVREDDLKILNFKSYFAPYILSFSGSLENDYSGNNFFVSPFLNEPIKVNPLKGSDRKFPVDFGYPSNNTFNSSILIPEGYEITYLPEELIVENDDVKILYQCTAEGNLINVKGVYSFTKSVYPASSYNSLKKYFDTIIKKFNDKIVIVKS